MVDGSSLGCHWLVKIALNSRSEDDRMLASDITGHWLQTIKTTASSEMADTFMLDLLETIPIHSESS